MNKADTTTVCNNEDKTLASKTYHRNWVSVRADNDPANHNQIISCQIAYADSNSGDNNDCVTSSTSTGWTADPFTTLSSIYLGGDSSQSSSNVASYTNLIFYPKNAWESAAGTMAGDAMIYTCDTWCNSSCYGPG